jgi:hypothetical protein
MLTRLAAAAGCTTATASDTTSASESSSNCSRSAPAWIRDSSNRSSTIAVNRSVSLVIVAW